MPRRKKTRRAACAKRKPAPAAAPLKHTREACEKHVARVRRICLALPGTTEKISHGEPTFFVAKRVYAMCSSNHHNDGHIAVTLPAPPGVQAEMIRSEPRRFYYPPYVGVSGWVGIELPEVSDDELGAHLADAWKFILEKSRKPRKRAHLPAK